MTDIIGIFPVNFRTCMQKINWDGIEEIRVRIGWPIELIYGDKSLWMQENELVMNRAYLDEMLNYITGYSLYAMEEELKQGFITLSGGHRIGLTGHATYQVPDINMTPQVTNITDINGLNIRVAHQKIGCATDIVPFLRNRDSIYNTLFFAAPGVGKTTYLRDAIRILSNGDGEHAGLKCCVVDERSEIGACKMGVAQNDLGIRTDVLDGCPKEIGMKMVLRSMSPQVIAVDELGKKKEFYMLEQMRCSGVKVIGTMHAGSMDEVLHNPMMKSSMETGAIERLVELIRLPDGKRTFCVYDEKRVLLWKG